MPPSYDSLIEFFKKAPAEIAAIVLVVWADLVFIYKIVSLSIGYDGPLGLSFIISFVQLIIFLVLLYLFRVAHHRVLSEERIKLQGAPYKEHPSLPQNENTNR